MHPTFRQPPGQHETASAGARQLGESCRDVLPTPSLRIDQSSHRRREIGRLDRPLAIVRVPRLEQLHDLTAIGIVGLDAIDALDWVAAAKREEGGAAPFGPLLEAAERTPAFKPCRVLPTEAPDGEGRPEQFPTVGFDIWTNDRNQFNPLGKHASSFGTTLIYILIKTG
jgi:hypothetical protein